MPVKVRRDMANLLPLHTAVVLPGHQIAKLRDIRSPFAQI
jgi:hypothetical protein